ncbi:hypothetical protein R3X27_12930 [Tropicimonas sp. TH_r6]|uniref:hypothetical protein n=1 Tax=Tropicimonas sp. TH_r6 TaxID=3082085 RepID=UPI002952AF83|nr:hypothetical protein [Tropicimonas sp. TH_r6]MDV7143583.1 hypothetical protein [Tropicimonas sp. TH_r6]
MKPDFMTVVKAELTPQKLVPGIAFVALLMGAATVKTMVWASHDECSIDNFAADAFVAWDSNGRLAHSKCYDMYFRNDADLSNSQHYAEAFEALMAEKYPRQGYKIGLHDPELQEMVGIPDSMFGVFYGAPFHQNGDVVKLDGQTFNYEPDMLMKVADAGIMEATNVEEVIKHLDGVYAFIELPAMLGDPDELPDSAVASFHMQALNLGARTGVMGEYFPFDQSDPDLLETLRNMTVVSANPDGTERSIYHTNEENVHWLITAVETVEHMKRRGESLKAGDLISVGAMMEAFMDFVEPIEGKRHVHYYIGDEVISVSAGFEE